MENVHLYERDGSLSIFYYSFLPCIKDKTEQSIAPMIIPLMLAS